MVGIGQYDKSPEVRSNPIVQLTKHSVRHSLIISEASVCFSSMLISPVSLAFRTAETTYIHGKAGSRKTFNKIHGNTQNMKDVRPGEFVMANGTSRRQNGCYDTAKARTVT